MILNVVVNEELMPIDVPDIVLTDAMELFAKMDRDMDQGWQMSRSWVDELNAVQRCQVVADRLLTAMETDNTNMKMMMAGYILYKLPNVKLVFIDTEGDVTLTDFEF